MSNPKIHPTAIVGEGAKLGRDVSIGPYAVIANRVEIDNGCQIGPHVVIHDYVRLGSGNRIHANAVLGDLPQDISFDIDSETWVEIGNHNSIREGVTIHRATSPERITRLGSNCYLMANSHIAHDCTVGDNVILTNNVCLGGHVQVEKRAILGGGALIHQFCRVGAYAMVAAFTIARKDVLPYTMVGGQPLRHYRLNSVGLRRNGISGSDYKVVEQAYRAIRSGHRDLSKLAQNEAVQHLQSWLDAPSKRGLCGFIQGKKFVEE